jgi:hypothetical protein
MVARGGIEPPTRGFSVRTSTLKICIILRLVRTLVMLRTIMIIAYALRWGRSVACPPLQPPALFTRAPHITCP